MSYIPNSAMPHAGNVEPIEDDDFEEMEDFDQGEPQSRRARALELVRDHPKTSAAAGAALLAGLAAAAALPFLSARDRKKSASGTARKSRTTSKSANGSARSGTGRSAAAKSTNGSGKKTTRSAASKPTASTRKPAAKRSRTRKNSADSSES
jgi:hypothetical protein